MSKRPRPEDGGFAAEVFDIAGTDPELLTSGRIPDPQPEHTALFRWLAEVLTTLEAFLRARGGLTLRMLIRGFWGMLAAIGIFLLVGPVINKPMDFDDVLASAKIEKVDWAARDAKIDYEVSRAPDGTFEAQVTESYNADFLHGPGREVSRRIVTEVNGHDAEFKLHSATIDGAPADVTIKRNATDTDVNVRRQDGLSFSGTPVVEIRYELRHLVRNTDDLASGAQGATIDEWAWPLFAPTWPQATKGLEVSVTLSQELNDALVRTPNASVGWLLLSSTEWLTPEVEPTGDVRYSFSNDDTLPPNADVWVTATFEDGTFTQPPKTTLFWVQTWGPLIPLALLAIIMLFSLAARWIVWADSAGEPWYVMRSEPPKAVAPSLAAHLLGKPRHAELIAVLEAVPGRRRAKTAAAGAQQYVDRDEWVRAVAQAARRAGRIGNLPSAWAWARRWTNRDTVAEMKLRWTPNSYVRDSFIGASIAVTLLQWGILRQLSEQFILLVVWWPFAFVAASTVFAAVTLWAVNRPRPLTPKGALVEQELKGIDLFARRTRLSERGPLDDPLLPYALLFEPPRSAGARVIEQAVAETRDDRVASRWRTEHFLSGPSIISFVASLALLAGAIVVAAALPSPYVYDEFQTGVAGTSDMNGDLWTQVEGFEIEAEVGRDTAGKAVFTATEQFQVNFTPSGEYLPQFVREWPATRFGQDLGFEIEAVEIDGEEVPFRTQVNSVTTAMTTELTALYQGLHEVVIRYSFTNPVVEVPDGDRTVQQLRWTALFSDWDDSYRVEPERAWGDRVRVRPLRIQLTISPELADEMLASGWIDYGHDKPSVSHERGDGFQPWVRESQIHLYDRNYEGDAPEMDVSYDLRIGAERTTEDGTLIVELDADEVGSRHFDRYSGEEPPAFEVNPEANEMLDKYSLAKFLDFGAVLNFPQDTFANVDPNVHAKFQVKYWFPLVALYLLTLLVTAVAVATFVFALKKRRAPSNSLLLMSVGTITLLAAAQSVVFWWELGYSTVDGSIEWGIVLAVTMWAAVIAQWIMVGRRSRPGGALSAPVRAKLKSAEE